MNLTPLAASVHLFKALADETRLRLLHLILHHEMNVQEITAVMGMGQSRISHHLKILSDSGLLHSRRDGLWTFYAAADNGSGARFISAVRYLMDGHEILQQDLQRARSVVEERSRQTQRFFDSIAESWPAMQNALIGREDWPQVLDAHIPPCRVAVDLGCGSGELLPLLGRHAASVIGVDKTPRMLELARRRCDGRAGVELRIGELEHLPLRDGEADFAMLHMVLHHLPQPQRAVAEAGRILQAGGTFLIVDFDRHGDETLRRRYGDRWLGFSAAEIGHWLQQSGFTPLGRERMAVQHGLSVCFHTARKQGA